MRFQVCSPADPPANTLLTEYFHSRERGAAHGTFYRIVQPEPAAFTAPAGVFLVLSDGSGSPVGCGGVRRIPAPASEPNVVRYEVKHLWVQPAARGQGAGRALLGELERRAAEFGATEVVLDTNAVLTAAGHLYTTSGYRSITPYNENPNATHWYAKPLRSP